MIASIIIPLTTPILLLNGPLRSIELRPPGREAQRLMAAARVGDGFPPEIIVRFAARLSGRSEPTLRRLGPDDMAAIGGALETLFLAGERRLRASNAAHANARAGSLDVDEEEQNEGA